MFFASVERPASRSEGRLGGAAGIASGPARAGILLWYTYAYTPFDLRVQCAFRIRSYNVPVFISFTAHSFAEANYTTGT